MTKPATPRYNIATITTKDIELHKRRESVKKFGYTDEDIYRKGIETLENELKSKSV